jgi:DtxR family Mn-dependent transcriptional regulator
MPDPFITLIVAFLIFSTAVFIFWPQKGMLARRRHGRYLANRVRREDTLKYVHTCEMAGRQADVAGIAGTLRISRSETADLLAQMQTAGLLTLTNGDIHLSPAGRESALHIIRAHRLWERYLADETGFREPDWHEQAEWAEHHMTEAEVDALEARLNYPTYDPHGDPIPSAGGELIAHQGQPLTSFEEDTTVRIVHLEDEPKAVFAQLATEQLSPGMTIHLISKTPEQVRFWANGDEHLLAPIVAANITVEPVPILEKPGLLECERLACLEPGETAEVVRISPACYGLERRRLMDLGILPGTRITNEMRSPSGDPTAYRIRGAVIALRQEQANLIFVKR